MRQVIKHRDIRLLNMIRRTDPEIHLCPRCLEGKVEAIKDGQTTRGEQYRSFACSNRSGGYDFFETKYGDLTPPGILVTEEMTAQDIERLREERRNRRKPILPQAPIARHNPIRGFNVGAALVPPQPLDEPQEINTDDLPF